MILLPRKAWRSIAAAFGLLPLTAQTPVLPPAPETPEPPEQAVVVRPPPPTTTPPALTAPPAPSPAPTAATPPPPATVSPLRLQKGSPPATASDMLRTYQELSEKRQRNYDKAQDISASQLLVLLDVARRTGAPLGDLMATGDLESARTWNDYVRPPIKGANGQPALGEAQGIWQFMPGTFASVIRLYGQKILRLSEADPAKGLPAMDLGNEAYTDTEIRDIIKRNMGNPKAGGEDLQALRSNFAVATLAKYCLDAEAGDASPEKRYLIHFLGAGDGGRAWDNANSPERRTTLAVKRPPEAEPKQTSTPPPAATPAGKPHKKKTPAVPKGKHASPAQATTAQPLAQDPADPAAETVLTPPVPTTPPPTPDTWGFDPDSATVRNNRWLFYAGSTPRTWGQFMDNLRVQVAADKSPAFVRQKYGVGFNLTRGDTPGWSAKEQNPKQLAGSVVPFASDNGTPVPLPKGLVYAPLNKDEQVRYVNRLSELVQKGEDQPRADLSPQETAWLTGALKRQGVLPQTTPPQTPVNDPAIVAAMQKFRQRVGMGEPDNPDHARMFPPALRVALETYDARLQPYIAKQMKQEQTRAHALNLATLPKADPAAREAATPQVIALKEGMTAAGLLQPKTKVVVETKLNSRGKPYKARQKVPLPPDGSVDKGLIAKLDEFQLRQGLRPTHGVLDTATLDALGVTLPPPAVAVQPIPAPLQNTVPPTTSFNPVAGTTPAPPAPPSQQPEAPSNRRRPAPGLQ